MQSGWNSPSFLADGTALCTLVVNDGATVQLLSQLDEDVVPQLGVVLSHDDFVAPAPPTNASRVALTAGGYRDTWTNKRIAVATGAIDFRLPQGMAAFSPTWSPDGSRLAYAAMPDDEELVSQSTRVGMMKRRIFVVDAQGDAQPQQITDEPGYRDERPLWSTDGGHILFARMDDDSRASLWLMPSDGGNPQQVVEELTPLPGAADAWFGHSATSTGIRFSTGGSRQSIKRHLELTRHQINFT